MSRDGQIDLREKEISVRHLGPIAWQRVAAGVPACRELRADRSLRLPS